jgi:peptide/nickel transport system substrate-binding protein
MVWLLAMATVILLPAQRVIRCGSNYEPEGIDPAQVWDDTSAFYVCNIFDTLVRFNPRTMKIEPSLAVGWNTSADGRTWTFQLRRGVRFHDGTPLDADAVVFTFFRQMDPANPRRLEDFPMFAGIFPLLRAVRKVDAFQVQFVLSEPFAPFLAALSVECAAIVSPDAVKKSGPDFSSHPVGSGPFKLSSWQKNRRLVLTANRDYWGGRPSLDEYVDIIEPQSEILHNSFKQGTLDILHSISISKMVSYEKLDWVQITSAPSMSVTFIAVNAGRPLLGRRRVRQALGRAWDPRALKLVFQDYVMPVRSVLPRGMMPDAPETPGTGFSLAQAQALLNKENIGREWELEMLLQKNDDLLLQLFSMYGKNLKQVGIKLKLTRLDPEAYADRVMRGDFDLACSGWIADYPDPDSMLFPLFSRQLQQQGFANIAAAGRSDLEDRLRRARGEGDAARRQAMYRNIAQAIVDDGLVIPIFQDKRILISNKRIGPLRPNPLGKLFLFDLLPK